jgi:hypothetical protein
LIESGEMLIPKNTSRLRIGTWINEIFSSSVEPKLGNIRMASKNNQGCSKFLR